MSEVLRVALALAAGLGLGTFYFGGLWLTVRRLPTARHPALLMLGSFFGRTVVVVLGICLAAKGCPATTEGDWRRVAARVVACLVGFVVARTLIVRRLRPREAAE